MDGAGFVRFAMLYAIRSIGRNKRRSLLTIGTIALSTMVSIVGSSYSAAVLKIWEKGVIDHGAGHAQYHKIGYWDQQDTLQERFTFNGTSEVEMELANDPKVSAFTRRLKFQGVISSGSKSVFFLGRGVDPLTELKIAPDTFSEKADMGSFVAENDMNGIVIGKGLAETLEVGIGDEASLMVNTFEGSINGVDVKIRGILDNPIPALSKRLLFMHIEAAQESIWVENKYTEIAIRLSDAANVEKWVDAHSTKANSLGLELRGWWQIDPYIKKVQTIWDSVIGVISVLLFVSAGIGVLNIVFMLVSERTVEIGTLMAIGAKPLDIRTLFTLEAAIYGLIGGVAGAFLGNLVVVYMGLVGISFASPFGSGSFDMYPEISWSLTLIVFISAIAICYLSALVPSQKAASVEPVTAFRGQAT